MTSPNSGSINAAYIRMELPIMLREIRQKRRLTQKEVGRRAGILAENVARFENSHKQWPSLVTIIRIADALDVKMAITFKRNRGKRSAG